MRIISDISSLSRIQVKTRSSSYENGKKIGICRPVSFTAIINQASKSSNDKQNDPEPHEDSMKTKNFSTV